MFRRPFAAALPLSLFALPSRAQAPKKLVVYTSNDSTLNDLVFGAFKTETGIEVEPVAAGSGVVMRRLQAEKARPLVRGRKKKVPFFASSPLEGRGS